MQFPSCSYESLGYLNPENNAKFPVHIKKKEDIGIPDVVKDFVLPFLPAKSLCRFKTISKEWHAWINNPFLAHKQATHFKHISGLFCQFPGESPSFISLSPKAYGVPSPSLSFLPEPVEFRATCNGLICCQGRPGDNAYYYICNPVTKEWRRLPKPSLYHGPETAIALAFEPSTLNFVAHYELICAVTVPDRAALLFEVYSSRSNSWRHCDTVCCEPDALVPNGDGFYMKGFVYWETQSSAVLAFCVKDEEYGIFRLPPSSGPTGSLAGMHGELCYLLPGKQDDAYTIEVYGNLDMSLKCIIPLNPQVVGDMNELCRALSFVNDDTLILVCGTEMIAYHVRAQKVEWLSNARTDGFARYFPYVNSLVPVAHSVVI